MNHQAKKTILLIEDDADQIMMYQNKFELSGFAFISADTAQEGLDRAKKEKLDIILLDLLLKELTVPTGFEILKKLKKQEETKNIPVIILTNYGTRQARDKGLKLGAKEFIIKSQVTPSKLVEKIKEILNK
ncbi:MAG: response regulator [Patescibacteria group bacterium]|nr:response regulator [Patescibacteria group bacterium]